MSDTTETVADRREEFEINYYRRNGYPQYAIDEKVYLKRRRGNSYDTDVMTAEWRGWQSALAAQSPSAEMLADEALAEVDKLLSEYPPDLIGTSSSPPPPELEKQVNAIMERVYARVEAREARRRL